MSSRPGSSWLAFFCATSRMCLSSFITSSSAWIDFSRPTNKGTIMCGKTTMSRSGRTGNMVFGEISVIYPRHAGGRHEVAARTWSPVESVGARLARFNHRRSAPPDRRACRPRSGRRVALAVGVDLERGRATFGDLLVDDALGDAVERGQLEHGVEQDALHDGPQAARTGLALDRLLGDRLQRILGEAQLDAFHVEQLLILLDQGVL